MTAREEGERKTEENAIKLVIEDNWRKYHLPGHLPGAAAPGSEFPVIR